MTLRDELSGRESTEIFIGRVYYGEIPDVSNAEFFHCSFLGLQAPLDTNPLRVFNDCVFSWAREIDMYQPTAN